MAILQRVTITGADDSISADQLAAFSADFPFVEWGILVSASNQGSPRYPSRKWMDRLCDWSQQKDFRVAVHVQGSWLRSLMAGDERPLIEGVGPLLTMAKRVQFNFHGGKLQFNVGQFTAALTLLPRIEQKTFLFQHDGTDGASAMRSAIVFMPQLDCLPFYDTSHGAGVLPAEWPKPEYSYIVSQHDRLQVGFAGGLGPDNVVEQIPRIAKAAGKNRFWIDMETQVRGVLGVFDLDKVKRVLELCAPFIGKEI